MYKIVQVNTVYGTGSTGKITAAIRELSNEAGYKAYVAYGRGKAYENDELFRIGNRIDFYSHVLVNFFLGKSGFGSQKVTKRFLSWLDEVRPDVIHLHNIHGFYIHVGMLFDYIKSKNIPVVWTLHDCWPFTGQCSHFDYAGCNKWIEGCYECPIYRSDYPYSLFRDNSKQNYVDKKLSFTGVKNMTIIAPSEWLANLVRKSYLSEYNVRVINNGINLSIFRTYDFNDESNDKILLAVSNVWDKRKGLSHILELSKYFNNSNGYKIVIIGLSKKQKNSIARKYDSDSVLPICRTSNQEELARWYSKAYAYINASLQENFPTTNLEALACGTPVITFASGGSPETLDAETGIVVEKGNVEALKDAINGIDNSNVKREACTIRAQRYDARECYRQYIDIYREIVENE